MDNLCHSLAGAALGEAGLKRTTRFGTATLVVASNLPDVDVLAFLTDIPSVALRRGWTHGVVAQLVLPVLLAGAFVALDRAWRPPATAGRRARPGALLLLSYVGVLLHVAMDWLNTYGVRLLMPLSPEWFYGDAVFIVDPWLWLTLGAGVLVARRRQSRRPALIAAALAAAYIVAMVASAQAARARVQAAWTAQHGRPPVGLMVGPVPLNPFRKAVIVEADGYYVRGTFSWPAGTVVFADARTPANRDHPAAVRARSDPDFGAILVWSRFPYYEIEAVPEGARVTLEDMRFGDRLFRATTLVPEE